MDNNQSIPHATESSPGSEANPLLVAAALHNSSLPISKLTEELLLAVFTAAQLAYRDTVGACGNTAEVTLAVSQVCGAWREIALAASTLWTRIDWPGCTNRPALYLVDCYLKRSGSMAIDIDIAQISSGNASNP